MLTPLAWLIKIGVKKMKEEFFKLINEYKNELKNAIKQHYPRFVKEHGEIYAYSLYSCDDACHIFPVLNRDCDVKNEEYRYQPDEYEHWDDYKYFGKASEMMGDIQAIYDDYYNYDYGYEKQKEDFPALMKEMEDESGITYSCFKDSRDFLFFGALQVLNELKQEKFFSDDIYLVVWPCDTASTIIEKSIKVLNKPEIIEKCQKAFTELGYYFCRI